MSVSVQIVRCVRAGHLDRSDASVGTKAVPRVVATDIADPRLVSRYHPRPGLLLPLGRPTRFPQPGDRLDGMESNPAELRGRDEGSRLHAVLQAAGRGVVGAMAMTGMRVMTTELGLVEQAPPQAISRQRARGLRALLRRAPRRQRRGLVEAAHWAFGACGGAAFGALPVGVRRRPWAGPTYGLVVWLGFELGIAPVLGLSQAKHVRPVDRLALAADHLLYGLVLSQGRRSAPG